MYSLLAQSSALLQDAFLTFILGLGVVFLGIAVIVLFVWAFGVIFNKFINRERAKMKQPKIETVKEEVLGDGEIPEHIKVAIITAVTAYYLEENQNGKKCDFIVRKIKRLY